MNRKFTDEAADAAAAAIANVIGHGMREKCTGLANAALEAALPHLQPNKPEAVRLRDELRERTAFEAWAEGRYNLDKRVNVVGDLVYAERWVQGAFVGWQAALAATGKQQVGEEVSVEEDVYRSIADMIEPYVQREGSNPDGPLPASVHDSVQIIFDHWLKIRAQVGEVQGDNLSPTEMADALERIAGGALSDYESVEADELHILRCAKLIRCLAASGPER